MPSRRMPCNNMPLYCVRLWWTRRNIYCHLAVERTLTRNVRMLMFELVHREFRDGEHEWSTSQRRSFSHLIFQFRLHVKCECSESDVDSMPRTNGSTYIYRFVFSSRPRLHFFACSPFFLLHFESGNRLGDTSHACTRLQIIQNTKNDKIVAVRRRQKTISCCRTKEYSNAVSST